MKVLPLVFDACRPRPEVISSQLSDAMFAARLDDVVQSKAHPFYQDASEFFLQTHATESMKSFFRQVMERLRGSGGASAYYRLDTPFGGGKTHTLIALWHLVTSGRTLPEGLLSPLGIKKSSLPHDSIVVGAVVGTDLDPSNGTDKGDGVKVYHLWGELAYQLGGKDGYELVAKSDSHGEAPSAGFLDRIVGDRPALILIDELANYLRRMPEATKNQLPAFFHNLAEWVSKHGTRRAMVVTFAEDAFREEVREIQESLAAVFGEVKALSAKYETVITPAERYDYPRILKRRLFEQVDDEVAERVARAYADLYRATDSDEFRLPEHCLRGDYVAVLRAHYPFHPTLIDLLDGKLATMPTFQKTRGALRLVARLIHHVWTSRPSDAHFIQPHHADIGTPDISDELLGRLHRDRYKDVAEIDIHRDDGHAHAQLIDRQFFRDELPYAQRVANVIFAHSLPEPPARGVYPAEIRLSVLTPQSNPGYINKALQELCAHTELACWHLDHRGDGEDAAYFFSLEPQLPRIITEEMQRVKQSDVCQEIERRIKNLWKSTVGFEVVPFPGDASQVKNEASAKLAIIHWDTATFDGNRLPEKVKEIWELAPGGEYRTFRNSIVFLVAAKDRVKNMLVNAKRYLAIDRIRRRPDEFRLNKEKQKELEELHKEQEGATSLSIARAYNTLLYPSEVADPTFKPFAVLSLTVEEQGKLAPNMLDVIIESLRGAEKLKRDDDPPLGAPFVIQNAFNKDEKAVKTEVLWGRFFERTRLPIVLTRNYLRAVILAGVKSGSWLFYNPAEGYAHGPATIDEAKIIFNESVEIVLPEEAKRRGLKVAGEPERELPPVETCPQCGQPLDECTCSLRPPRREIEVEDEPGKAFGDMERQARDEGWSNAASLVVAWDGEGAELANRLIALRIILSQVSPLVDSSWLNLEMNQTNTKLGKTPASATFRGPGDFYLQNLASSFESFAKHFDSGFVGIDLELTFTKGIAISGADWSDMREAFKQAGLGSSKWKLIPKTGKEGA